jgi:hypothetical protein
VTAVNDIAVGFVGVKPLSSDDEWRVIRRLTEASFARGDEVALLNKAWWSRFEPPVGPFKTFQLE